MPGEHRQVPAHREGMYLGYARADAWYAAYATWWRGLGLLCQPSPDGSLASRARDAALLTLISASSVLCSGIGVFVLGVLTTGAVISADLKNAPRPFFIATFVLIAFGFLGTLPIFFDLFART